jgi:hypothetical protein
LEEFSKELALKAKHRYFFQKADFAEAILFLFASAPADLPTRITLKAKEKRERTFSSHEGVLISR